MRPKGTKKAGIKYLSEPEMAAFMKATRKNKRDSFLFSLMLFVGGRVSEICQIRLKDVNEGSFQIFIQAKKNGTSRHYTMSGKLWKKYRAWMRERAKMEHADMNPYLFMTCLLVLSLSLIGCTTVTTIGGVRGFYYPTPREDGEMGVRIRSGSGVDKEVVSIDQDMLSPTPDGPEPSVPVELTELEIMAVVLIIISITHSMECQLKDSVRPKE